MSFKYRLILFYIIIEVFFITLIVGVNFSALNFASEKLTKEKVSSNVSLIEDLIKVPLSIYDLATLDNIVEKTVDRNIIDTLLIYDSQNVILSSRSKHSEFLNKSIDFFKSEDFKINNMELETRFVTVKEDNIILGSFIIVFNLNSSNEFIKENRNMTLLLILIEILISLFVSYYTGNKLTKMLEILTQKARKIGEGEDPDIPYLDKNDEIGTLAKAMNKMKLDLEERRNNILNIQKQKDSFFANMSHELKTPLNSINIISTLMLKNKSGNLDENELKNIKIMNSCGKDLLVLINDILDISRIESGQVKINPQQFNFNKLFEEITDMFLLASNEKGLEFTYKKDEDLTLIYNDEVRIKQIIVNLIGNAIKFTEKGKIELNVYLENNKINISIKDEGIGIPKEKQKLIFERFKQVDDGISRKYGGTGLGLAICKDLSKLLGGDIIVNSELGIGSEFIVSIDKNLDEENLNTLSINKEKQEYLNDVINNKKRHDILLLNNDVISFMKYTIELKRESNSLVQVNEISQFISHLTKSNFDIIIINIENFSQYIIFDSLRGIEFEKLYLISKSDAKIDKNLLELSTEVFVMPINKEEFISKVTS